MPARRSSSERALARLLTGPVAFGFAGTIDLLAVVALGVRYVVRRRYHASSDDR